MASRIAEILHNTMATRHNERCQTGATRKSGRTGPSKTPHLMILRESDEPFFLSLQRRSMSDFGFSSSSSPSSSGGMNGTQRAELMEQVQNQLMVATLQEMLTVSFKHDMSRSGRYMCSSSTLSLFPCGVIMWSKIDRNENQLPLAIMLNGSLYLICRFNVTDDATSWRNISHTLRWFSVCTAHSREFVCVFFVLFHVRHQDT